MKVKDEEFEEYRKDCIHRINDDCIPKNNPGCIVKCVRTKCHYFIYKDKLNYDKR